MQITKANGVEVIPEPKPTSYWMRHKKPALNFLYDSPFAAERQLEDQRYLNELNRNPRLNDFTRMDKLRSVQIAQTTGQSRSVAIKANVVNKVVREASGIHNYTIVPPPRLDDARSLAGKEPLEPETNPLVRAYAQEAKSKPIVCSFGHRPKSASRTFHPATMKFRLKHGQILPSVKDGKTGVGLPVAVLKKVLHAPKIQQNFADVIGSEVDIPTSAPSSSQGQRMHHTISAPGLIQSQPNGSSGNLRNNLFLSKDEQDDLFATNKNHTKARPHGKLAPLDTDSKGSWISSVEERQKRKKEKSERPDWDEGFHRIIVKTKDRLELKKSLLNPKSDKPLSELLHRFDSKVIAENQPSIFCPEKQELDKAQWGGQVLPVPKPVPLKGRPLYTDPWDIQVQQIKMLRKMDEEIKEEQRAEKQFQENLRVIPKVNYYPTTILKKMKHKQERESSKQKLKETQAGTTAESSYGETSALEEDEAAHQTSPTKPRSAGRRSNKKSHMDELVEKYPHWEHTEEEMNLALTLAKRGDRRALYDFHLAAASNATNRALPSAWRSEQPTGGSSGLSELEDWDGTSQSAVSAMSDSQVHSHTYPSQGGDVGIAEEEEESTVIGRVPPQYASSRDDQATVTFADLERQKQGLQEWDLDHQQRLDENTIE